MSAELVLALETSGPRGGVALASAALPPIVRDLGAERAYSSELFPLIRALLADSGHTLRDVGLFCFSAGPGSFTGLRIAATVGRMLHSIAGCRVVAVPTLDAIAFNALAHEPQPARIVALLDARRGQAYAAAYEPAASNSPSQPLADLHCTVAPAVRNPADWLPSLAPPFVLTGAGVAQHRAACVASGGAILDEALWRPRADVVAALGQRRAAAGAVCRPEEIVPLYVRPPECEEVYDQRRAAARARRAD